MFSRTPKIIKLNLTFAEGNKNKGDLVVNNNVNFYLLKSIFKVKQLIRSLTATVLLISFFVPEAVYSQPPTLRFNSIDMEQGLSYGVVRDIVQDDKGMIWIATGYGLNRFDGYDFRVFKHNHDDEYSLPGNDVNTLYKDSKGRIWIGYKDEGLALMSDSGGRFINFTIPGSRSLAHTIIEGPDGDLWIGGEDHQIHRFDLSDSSFSTYRIGDDDPKVQEEWHISPYENDVFDIAKDSEGNFWVSVLNKGLYKWSPQEQKELERFYPDSPYDINKDTPFHTIQSLDMQHDSMLWAGAEASFFSFDLESHEIDFLDKETFPEYPFVIDILAEENGMIWLATMNDGLCRYNSETGEWDFFQSHPYFDEGINMNTIFTLFKDQSGLIWAGTNGKGVNTLSTLKSFWLYPDIPSIKHGLLNRSVRAVTEDHQGNFWFASYTGVDRLSPEKDELQSFPFINPEGGYFYNPNSYSLLEDSEERMWMGSEGSGLFRILPEEGRLVQTDLERHHIFDLEEGPEGNIWLATNGGLFKYDPVLEEVTEFLAGADERIKFINSITASKRGGVFWLAANGGIIRFNTSSGEYTVFNTATVKLDEFPAEHINSVYEGAEDSLWLNTKGNGLCLLLLDRANNPESVSCYKAEDGLSSDLTYGFLTDKEDNFWISTSDGISKFNPGEGAFKNFNKADGLQAAKFNAGAFYETNDGEFFFGGVNGFSSFYPEDIQINTYVPPLILSDIRVNNLPAYQESLPGSPDKLTFSYQDNPVVLTFASLDFHAPERNQYAYKIEGTYDGWVDLGNTREIMLTQLPPGSYSLKVRSSNNDGVWNDEGLEIDIAITAPFYRKASFYQAVGLILILILMVLSVVFYQKIQFLQNVVRFLNIKRLSKEKQEEQKNGINEQLRHKKLFDKIEKVVQEETLYQRSNLSIKELAHKLNTNELYISRAINECSGMNFNHYINNFRINAAKELLMKTGNEKLTISEVGDAVGFSSPSTFSRAFNSYTGLTPSQFRKLQDE